MCIRDSCHTVHGITLHVVETYSSRSQLLTHHPFSKINEHDDIKVNNLVKNNLKYSHKLIKLVPSTQYVGGKVDLTHRATPLYIFPGCTLC